MGMWGEALLIGKGSDPVTQECSAVEHYVKKVTIIWGDVEICYWGV